ncbi:MAG TPA: nicotinate-nucleotide--dimethylbenzimidazole phosphoribosyltransferase [Gemmatimonadaceae bacterium]|nr:nicotinate-nucleotide--dimethylbenzimidazole phosphoribosyltransferase [Gemmatimonadaceae bacterium]
MIAAAAQRAIDEKTKPQGSLGELETWAVRLACIQNTLTPHISRARILVFGADHGVATEGVSAYPPQVTPEMMRNFARGGAAINVLARANGLEVEVIDVGVNADLTALDGIVHAKVRAGSRNMLNEPAMTADECKAAMDVGREAVRRAAAEGVRAVGLGEMGIGNTTAAAALLSGLTGASASETVGRGTGVDDERLAHKREVVAAAVAKHVTNDPARTLAALGGLELAAIAGAALEAPAHRMIVVADGFISTVATLAAVRIDPNIRANLFWAHRSAEQGHGVALDALGALPMLDLRCRLGEGTGAALALPLLRSAAAVLTEMATFASASVSGKA